MAQHKIKTSKGVKITIDDRQLSDWRFISALADVDSGDESRLIEGLPVLARLLFGKEEKEVLKSLQDEDGYTDFKIVLQEIKDTFDKIKEIKDVKN